MKSEEGRVSDVELIRYVHLSQRIVVNF